VDRYQRHREPASRLEIWKFNWRVDSIRRGWTLRLMAEAPFVLRWTADEWQTIRETPSVATAVGIEFADVPVSLDQDAPVRFTFFWIATAIWEGRDFVVTIDAEP
jgi:glucoamylase